LRSISFAKTDAHGNDFLLVSESEPHLPDPGGVPGLAVSMCDRRRGVGADGLIVYRAERGEFAMTLFNSDGSRAEISGNGLRCLAAYLVYRGVAESERLEVRTGAGRLALTLMGREDRRFRFRADMGPPRIDAVRERLEVEGETFEITALSMGNPHCVLFTSKLDLAELRRVGPRIERHPRFPEKTNVELVEVVSPNDLRMAIWERGAGETTSSGTGSAASAVASIRNGLAASPVRVHCSGGTIGVEWDGAGPVFVTGEAVVVAEGAFPL
jgi:diaminopimelate epimerase